MDPSFYSKAYSDSHTDFCGSFEHTLFAVSVVELWFRGHMDRVIYLHEFTSIGWILEVKYKYYQLII